MMNDLLHQFNTVAVVGAGAMGSGIAQIAAQAGHQVYLFDAKEGGAEKAIENIRTMFFRLAEKGKITAHVAETASERLHIAKSLAELHDANLVVEAIVENLEIKQTLFTQLEEIVSDQCILATNTSSISVTAIGAKLRLPTRLVGMHFFNPVPLMALVEIISGLATDRIIADTAFALGEFWGKKAVHTTSTPGFIVNRVARPYYAEGLRVATEQAATPATLDAIMRESGGFRMGPFELMDMIGHDVNFAVTSSVFAAYFNDPRFTPSLLQQELVNAGFLGKKTGRGFYQYGKDAPLPQIHTATVSAMSGKITVNTANASGMAVAKRLKEAGVTFHPEASSQPYVLHGQYGWLFVTDGRTATQRSVDEKNNDIVLLDLVRDFTHVTRVALTQSKQCSQQAFNEIIGIFSQAGIAVSPLGDVPGMLVMRTVAMLANEAADAVNQGVCNVAAVDIAMQKGVNYPTGPLAWADAIGLNNIQTVLKNIATVYGEDRYRISPLIQQKVLTGDTFYGTGNSYT